MIAILLVTCGRLEYTRQTLESFSAQNPDARTRFLLLHADDASDDPAILALATEHGFETMTVPSTVRAGARAMRTLLITTAAARGADWIVVLENDWEWVRPFPWALFDVVATTRPEVYCLRLYGQYKARGQRLPCCLHHLGRQGRPAVTWRPMTPAPEAAEIADIHWGGPPAVTRIAEALRLHAATFAKQEAGQAQTHAFSGRDLRSDVPEMIESGLITAKTVRVVSNVVYHIGDQQTPKRPGGRPSLYTPTWQTTRRWTQESSTRCLELAWQDCGVPRSLLDVGCGDGHLVTRARAMGIDAMGVDLSIPDGTGGLRHADLREPVDLGRQFDLVLCWEVAEHLPSESAGLLCDTLVRHLAPGGVLLFTAAAPGQGGQGHINEQPKPFWRDRLAARGLLFDDARTANLARDWARDATRTPWYGANLQVFVKAGSAATFRPAPVSVVPRIAITMRTADRTPKPNYLGGTIRRLVAQGLDPALIHVCASHPDVAWLAREVPQAAVTLHVPPRPLSPNENGLAQIRVLDPAAFDWVLLLEDDLAFCADFVGSVQRWLAAWARPDRHLYRLFGFRLRTPSRPQAAYDDWTADRFAGSQAVLLRMADAGDFLAWSDANLLTWGGFRGNARIAFDKLLASWAQARWPRVPFVVSHPLFVQHVGDISSLHPRAARNDALFAGSTWRYQEATA
jgi:SAM-dependent methyltransferase